MSTGKQLAPALLLALLICGCLPIPSWEVQQAVTLNPDRSGKLTFDATTNYHPNPFQGEDLDIEEDPQRAAGETVERMIGRESGGIEAWAEMSYEIRKDGRIRIKGTAYFPDCRKLKAPWRLTRLPWTKTPEGMMLGADVKDILPQITERPAAGPPKTPTERKLTDEEIQRRVLAKKMSYQQMRPLMAGILDGFNVETTFFLPGKTVEVSGFKKTPDGGLRITIEGRKLLEVFDKIVTSDELLAPGVEGEKGIWKSVAARKQAAEIMYGPDHSFRAKVTGDLKPLFDYKAEVEKARKAMPEMFKKLKINPELKASEKVDPTEP
ncbi:MAG: hypothetical protein ACYTF6_04530 [Planctomycetota bacterium]|jgi:hypothetical protein